MPLIRASLSFALALPVFCLSIDAQSTSFVDPSHGQHTVYVGRDGNIHQIFYDPATNNQLVQNLGGSSTGVISSYVDQSGGQHISYISNKTTVRQIVYDPNTNGISDVLLGGSVEIYRGQYSDFPPSVTSFVDPSGGQHVFYVGQDLHVHQLLPVNGIWTDQNLGGLPNPASPLASFADPSGGQHVAFLDQQFHVHQLYYNIGDPGWTDQNLGAIAYGDVAAFPIPGGGGYYTDISNLTGYVDGVGTQHIVYIANDGNVWQIFYDGSWHNQNLGGSPNPLTALTSYVDQSGGQHIIYESSNGDLHQFFYNGNLINQDLSSGVAFIFCGLTAYVDSFGGQHIIDFNTNGYIHQVYYNGNLFQQDLAPY